MVVAVSFLDKELEVPVVHEYSEVGNGTALLREDAADVQIAISMGDFASEYIADKSTFEDQSFAWTYKKGISDVTFHIALKTKGGMYAEYGHDQLVYTDERFDYPDLSDEQFANEVNSNYAIVAWVPALALAASLALFGLSHLL